METKKAETEWDTSDPYQAYLEYNKILRTWFVAFGVGGPGLFLVNTAVAERLAELSELKCVATLFMVGTASQVLGALLNKAVNWYVYSSTWEGIKTNFAHKAANWFIHQFWIDITVDLITIVCFGFAVWQLLTAFVPEAKAT